ncbi:hypothetical protein F511_19181 [Dorcoceras hygrometricum]|uniref:Uncharacterized protein n=1 Tax=Dorcoceras hygrometricum TaxID=472368 RepID=A0A2Z7AAJ9_9LAMI|nr:hypothetical protein F511_19181 [Dorcoceras hygrometricum]
MSRAMYTGSIDVHPLLMEGFRNKEDIQQQLYPSSRWFAIYRSAVGLVFMESADELAMETSRVDSDVRNQAMAKLNQLEHDEPAETGNQLQVLKERSEPAGSCIEKLAEESYSKKKFQVISTADESVSSRKDISTVDESINSHNSRRRRSVDGAGTKKFSKKLQLDISRYFLRRESADDEDQLELDLVFRRKESKDQQKLIEVEEYISSEAVDELSKISVSGALFIVNVQEQRAIAAHRQRTKFSMVLKQRLLIFLILNIGPTSGIRAGFRNKEDIQQQLYPSSRWFAIYRSAVGLVFMDSADELAMETSRVDSDVRNQAMAKLNQLEHDEPAETVNQLQVLKERSEPAGSCIEKLAEESYSKKKFQVISTADEFVSSRKDISTVDESINSHNSRRRRSVDGAGTKKFSKKLQLDISRYFLRRESADDEDQLERKFHNSRRRRSVDGAGTKKFSKKLQLDISRYFLRRESADDEDQLERSSR